MVAVAGAWLSLACWFVEVISLHEVDIVLYYRVCGFMVIALIWLLLGAMTAIGIQAQAAAAAHRD
jgi:hypothetical protein